MIAAAAFLSAASGYFVSQHADAIELQLGGSAHDLLFVSIALATGVVVLLRPAWGLPALVVFVFLNLSQSLVRYHDLPSLLQWLALPLALAAVYERFHRGWHHLRGAGPLTAWLLLFTLVLALSSVGAREPSLSDARLLEAVKALLLYLLVLGLASSRPRIHRAVAALLVAGALTGGLGIYQTLTGSFDDEFLGLARIKHAHIYGNVFEPRIAGPLGDPNFFAQVLVLLVPLGFYFAWGRNEKPYDRRRLFGYTSAGVITAAAILTYSRGGAIALGVVAIAILADRGIRPRAIVIALFLMAGGALLVPAEFTRRVATIEQLMPCGNTVAHPDSSFEKRKLLMTSAWRMFLDRPWLGVGAGNYTVHYESYADEVGSPARQYDEADTTHFPHSLGLEIAAETGLLGLGVFAAMVATCFGGLGRARKVFQRLGELPEAALARGLQIALLGYFVTALFLHGHFQRYLWVVLGLVAALSAAASESQAAEDHRPDPDAV